MSRIVKIILCLSVGSAAFAQAPQPGPEMKKLEAFNGTWVGKMKHYMEPGAAPQVTDGTLVFDMIMGGMYQRMTYTSEMPGMGKIDGLILTGYDAQKKCYRSWNYNNFIPVPVEETSNWEGESIVGKSVPMDMGMGPMVQHSTVRLKGKDEMVIKIDGEMGGQRFTMLEIELKRK